jgi:hypothetical protein
MWQWPSRKTIPRSARCDASTSLSFARERARPRALTDWRGRRTATRPINAGCGGRLERTAVRPARGIQATDPPPACLWLNGIQRHCRCPRTATMSVGTRGNRSARSACCQAACDKRRYPYDVLRAAKDIQAVQDLAAGTLCYNIQDEREKRGRNVDRSRRGLRSGLLGGPPAGRSRSAFLAKPKRRPGVCLKHAR